MARAAGGIEHADAQEGVRLNVHSIGFIRIVVEHLFFEPIGICRETIAQRAQSRGRRGADAAHQRKRAPEGKPAAALVRASALDHTEAVIKHGVMECTVRIAEVVRGFSRFVLGKCSSLAPVPAHDIDPPPLHKVAREPDACGISVECAVRELFIEKAQQATESRFVAAVRGGRQQDQMALAVFRETASSAMSYRHQFTDANEKLEKPIDHRTLRSIIESLLVAGKRAEQENRALEARLQASKREIQNLQTKLHIARCESLTDPLTQITSRKGFDQALETGITKAELARSPLSLLLIDIDHFKRFNDTFGHLVGDSVLRLVASVIKESVKGQDTAARYGGEEFAVILPNTSLADATTVAENIRTAVMSKEMVVRSTGQRLGRITISIGVAELHIDEFGKSLIARADRCLYAAKERGRNQVVSEREVETNAAAAVNCST
ncbi:MAG TPA: GGDEF domain-containing protein [Xanthobacteraceae bacterium]|nr:GGDEF domain-containing protein [Xanthobacteraceae bacterium]